MELYIRLLISTNKLYNNCICSISELKCNIGKQE